MNNKWLQAVSFAAIALIALLVMYFYNNASSHAGAGDLALIYVAAYQAIHYVGQTRFVGLMLRHLRRLVRFQRGRTYSARTPTSPGREPSVQLILSPLLSQSLLVLLEALEHLLVRASLELLAVVGDARLAIVAELAVQLEVQLLYKLFELKARRPYRRLRHLRAWPCRKVELIR